MNGTETPPGNSTSGGDDDDGLFTFDWYSASIGVCQVDGVVTVEPFVCDAFVAAGAVVNRDVKPYALVAGVPARQIGWMSRYGERLDFSASENGEAICSHTGARYQLLDKECICLDP